MIIIFFILSSILNTFSAEVYFSPSTDCENHIIENITKAEKSIDIAVYSINNDQIVDAILKAQKRTNLKIRILTDVIQASGHSSKVPFLYESGLTLKVHSVHKIMHNKFAIFDSKTATNGSYNWTNPASEVNNENCVFFGANEISVIEKYQKEFEKLWELNPEEKSKEKLMRIINKTKQIQVVPKEAESASVPHGF
jgi:phosphatidylserine/phosphatidylglycerophosphate/cardiolipin synthase-like enzyme